MEKILTVLAYSVGKAFQRFLVDKETIHTEK